MALRSLSIFITLGCGYGRVTLVLLGCNWL